MTALAVADRSGLIEEYHDGVVAVIDAHGGLVVGAGRLDRPFYIRSAAKPFQAHVALDTGVDLPPTHIAVACASHSGDPVHVAIVEDILARYGLSESDLQCPPARPHPAADRRLAVGGDTAPAARYHNCSGKHAAALAACVVAGWDLRTYAALGHPLQQRVGELMAEVTSESVEPAGVDGCGFPVWRVTAEGLARAFAALGNDERFAAVHSAMTTYPMLVSGEGRTDGEIGRWTGAAAKAGAAGCMGVAVAGYGIGVKAWTGSQAAVAVGVGIALEWLGVDVAGVRAGLDDVLQPVVLGADKEVGRFRPVATLESE